MWCLLFVCLAVDDAVVVVVETVCIGACWFLCFSLFYDLISKMTHFPKSEITKTLKQILA